MQMSRATEIGRVSTKEIGEPCETVRRSRNSIFSNWPQDDAEQNTGGHEVQFRQVISANAKAQHDPDFIDIIGAGIGADDAEDHDQRTNDAAREKGEVGHRAGEEDGDKTHQNIGKQKAPHDRII